MSQDLVFRLLPEKREEFLQGIDTKILKKALNESAGCFYTLCSKEDIQLWMNSYLKHADAISDGIVKMGNGTLLKPSKRWHQLLYDRIVGYALSNGFGELITEEQSKESQTQRFLTLFEKEPIKAKPVHNPDRPIGFPNLISNTNFESSLGEYSSCA
jgi:hypothetical protein